MKPREDFDKRAKDVLKVAGGPEIGAAALLSASGTAGREQGFLTVLCARIEPASEEVISFFAERAGLDLFSARQRLASPIPRPWRRDAMPGEAMASVQWLRSIGLRCYAVGETELNAVTFHPCLALFKQPRLLLMETSEGETLKVPMSSIACIVAGETTTSVTEERASAPGQPGGVEHVARNAEFVIDLHLRSSETAMRIRQDEFQFARVLPGATEGTAVQARAILKMIRKALPSARFYSEFAIAETTLTADGVTASNAQSTLARRGIASGMRVETSVRTERSTVPLFDLYSRLARFEVLRGA